jgi:serine/threonine protein kinase
MLRSGDEIGPYTLINKLGKGAFGVVWLAERRTRITTTTAALKIPLDDEITIESIKNEADLWVRASGHPNVLPIIEANIYDEQIIIASEYAPDGSLDSFLKRNGGVPPIESAVEIVAGILAGLEHLHSRSIIHRDLKPANILFQGATPRLADFGISRVLKSTGQSSNIMGTPSYMAPEAFDGKRNEQTDIWSVGVIFYQLLAGHLPYREEDITSLVGAILMRNPEPLPANVPKSLQNVVARALAKDTSLRYKSAAEMRAALRNPHETDPNFHVDKSIFTRQSPVQTMPPLPVHAPPAKRSNAPHVIYAIAGLAALAIIILGLGTLLKSDEKNAAVSEEKSAFANNRNAAAVNNVSVAAANVSKNQSTPVPVVTLTPPSGNLGVLDELNGSSTGNASGISYIDALNGKAAVFSRASESRIEYGNSIPTEGTLEWWINIKSGYSYTDYKLSSNEPHALLFTTAAGDVWYPGSAWLTLHSDGKVVFDLATTKYDGPKQTLIARNTGFTFNKWHALGISFGSQGQYIMLDGVIIASAPQNKQKLGRGGTHDAPVDIPTIGELVSGFWENNRYDSGFEGSVDRFRISNSQKDWYLSAESPK